MRAQHDQRSSREPIGICLPVQIGYRGEILCYVAKRFVDCDLAIVFATSNAAGEYLADLTDHMRIVDDAGLTRDRQFGRLSQHARTIIGDVARLCDERRVDFDGPEIARADQIDVRPWLDPVA